MLKAFVFDIGDTMHPSSKLEADVLYYIQEEHNLPDSFADTYLKMDYFSELYVSVENPPEKHFNHARGELRIMKMTLKYLHLNLDAEALSSEMNKLYELRLKRYYLKDPQGKDVADVIHFLNRNNFKVGILSDNPIQIKQKYLKLYNELGFKFDCFIVSEEVGFMKPSPKMFDAAIEKLDVKPSEAVYFGNNLERDAAAQKLGWNFVWVYGFNKNPNPNNFQGDKVKFINLRFVEEYIKKNEIN